MKEQKTYHDGPDAGYHLDENGLAVYAEYLRHQRDDLPDELRIHVENCGHCRAEIMALTDLLDDIPESRVTNHESRVTNHASRILRLIASLAAVVLLAWIIQLFRDKHPESAPTIVSTPQDTQVVMDTTLDIFVYAQAFIPDPDLESLVSATFREAGNPLPEGPSNDRIFHPGDTLRITWSPEPGQSHSFTILDNQGFPRTAWEKLGDSPFSLIIDLTPGLYYWKFTGEKVLWKVGRFTVRETEDERLETKRPRDQETRDKRP